MIYRSIKGLGEGFRAHPAAGIHGARVAADNTHVAGLAGRYATAVFELALEERAVDALGADFANLKTMLGASEDLVRLVRSPVLTREEQAGAMEAILERAAAPAAHAQAGAVARAEAAACLRWAT